MVAIAALPITAVLGLGASVLSNVTARWVGLVVLVAAVVAVGAWVASVAIDSGAPVRTGWWWRLLPYVATAGVVVAGLTEIISGSKAPDPILAMWFLACFWLYAFVPLASGASSRRHRVIWPIAPVVSVVVIVFVWTAGFFSIRFERSLDEFDAFADRLSAGERFEARTEIGSFVVRNRGRLPGCDQAFRITGFHELDDRWIARCPDGRPEGDDIDHIAGEWYEYPGRL